MRLSIYKYSQKATHGTRSFNSTVFSSITKQQSIMQDKLVIDVSMHGDSSQKKAKAAAVVFPGVLGLSSPGRNPGYIQITGDGIEPIGALKSIRQCASEAKLVSFSAVRLNDLDGAIWLEFNHCDLQKVLIEMPIASTNSLSEAMKIVAGSSGVLFVALRGNDLRYIEMTGRGIDVVKLVRAMRREVGEAKLVNLTPIMLPEAEGYWFNLSENNPATEPRLIWCPSYSLEPSNGNYFTTNYGGSGLKMMNIKVNGGKETPRKAMAVVGGFPGVLSAAMILGGEAYIQITGRDIDAVGLVNSIKKKAGDAELLNLI